MADYLPRIVHKDEERFTEGGHTGRFILPSQPGFKPGCTSRFVTEVDGRQRPEMLEFWNRPGDISTEERLRYPDPTKAPHRSMKVFEGDASLCLWDVPIVSEFKLQVLDKGPDGAILPPSSAWFQVLWQRNYYQKGTTEGRGPAVNIGVCQDFVMDAATAKPMRDAARREIKREFFSFDINYLAAPGVMQKARVGKWPLDRRAYDVKVTAIDSRGGPGGQFTVEMDGKIACDYRGPIGFFDMRSGSYAGYGTYRQYNAVELFGVRFTGYREQVAP